METHDTSAVLPPLYARWINDLLGAAVPAETRATCDDCAMCAPEGAPEDKSLYFSPQVKCCSYQPKLPNYLVGRILADRDFAFSAGRATLERRIDTGVGVTPLGLDQAVPYSLLYQYGVAGFGRAESLRCPHFLEEGGGRCGIWRNRNSVCTTWFCKHERGAVGLTFWNCIRDLLVTLETDLAAWCVLESGLETEAMAAVFPARRKPNDREMMTVADLEGRGDPMVSRRVWGRWHGREREFYGECAERASPLTWNQVERIVSPGAIARARIAQKAFRDLVSKEVPDRLAAGSIQLVSSSREGVRVVSYSGSDPLDLTPDVFQILNYFDGRPTQEVLESIRTDLGLEVEEDLLRKLTDFEILASVRSD